MISYDHRAATEHEVFFLYILQPETNQKVRNFYQLGFLDASSKKQSLAN